MLAPVPGGLNDPAARVSADTPPTLLLCSVDDRDDIALGVPALFVALRKAGVPVEMHVYGNGGHGWGIRPGENAVNDWPNRLVDWLDELQRLARSPLRAMEDDRLPSRSVHICTIL